MTRTLPHPVDPHFANLVAAFATHVTDRVSDVLVRAGEGGGMTATALLALSTWSECSIAFLAKVLGLTHSGAVRLVDRLVSNGLVRRERAHDARTASLSLTARGSRTAAVLRRERRRIVEDLVRAADEAERQTLKRFMARALEQDRRSREEARHLCRACDHSVCVGSACPVGSSVQEGSMR